MNLKEWCLQTAKAYRNGDPETVAKGICTIHSHAYKRAYIERSQKLVDAIDALPDYDDIGYKWPCDDSESRAAFLEAFAETL